MSEQLHHYYVACAYGWAVGISLNAAMRRLTECTHQEFIKRSIDNGGMHVVGVRVEAPISATYDIDGFLPSGVEYTDKKAYVMTSIKGAYREK